MYYLTHLITSKGSKIKQGSEIHLVNNNISITFKQIIQRIFIQ